jgi:hypothetical protein
VFLGRFDALGDRLERVGAKSERDVRAIDV